jgi:hypothetical protein
MTYNLYWGDLHSHCSISYGHGTVEQALARARQQLDFCSITGHAFWPDMPTDRARYGEIIDYHREGFARLARNWEELLRVQREGSTPGEFLALPSYEWHSLEYGDHNVYAPGPELALRDAPDLPALRKMASDSGAIIVPHHIGYAAGYRGIDWRHFREDRTPFVEIFSLHGCSEGEHAPYPMLHDMGPRDFGSTAEAGWSAGHRFGLIASTDHHGAYPGSHGDGRLGVFAKELTREALWEALLERRVFAATGDRIDARLWIDDAWIGSSIRAPGKRRVRVEVRGADKLDRVELIKNGSLLKRLFPVSWSTTDDEVNASRLRITWGWGRKDQPVHWHARLSLSRGSITDVETCFSGQAVAAPKGVAGHSAEEDEADLPHCVTERGEQSVVWRSITSGNPTLRHSSTQALSLGLLAPPSARLTVEVNGCRFEHELAELRDAGHAHYLRGWLSEAIRIGPLVRLAECSVRAELDDNASEWPVDRYYLRVAQANNQWAWLSPIWAER